MLARGVLLGSQRFLVILRQWERIKWIKCGYMAHDTSSWTLGLTCHTRDPWFHNANSLVTLLLDLLMLSTFRGLDSECQICGAIWTAVSIRDGLCAPPGLLGEDASGAVIGDERQAQQLTKLSRPAR